MANPTDTHEIETFEGLDERLAEQLPTFELFFKTFGFKRIHGRVWGLLVLAGVPLSSKEISNALEMSQGATSSCLNELAEWGAIRTSFDSAQRCHVHSPVGNTLSIVATVFRRREQVVLGKLRTSVRGTLEYVRKRYGERDPRVLTLKSILSSCEIAEAVMQLVFSSVERALGDSQSLLSKALGAALKVGIAGPAKVLSWAADPIDLTDESSRLEDVELSDPSPTIDSPPSSSEEETPNV
ncbi:MAG: DNA-binding transcriptional regulator GbsR (MarR family) [Candidatus Paceibacteria bacterium]|jgi:DNA-binding transcriptional regulator GbsR (MarR family)